MSSVYKINKGINKPIEFKGLKAQYIWWLAGCLLLLLILFIVLYISGVNAFICILFVFVFGSGAFVFVYRMSNTFGEHGLSKWLARRNIPRVVKSFSRKLFMDKQKV